MQSRLWSVLGLLLIAGIGGCGGSDSPSAGRTFAQQAQEAQRLSSPELRAVRLMDIAAAQRKAQDRTGAEDTLGLARKACELVSEPAAQARLSAQLALEYARCQNHSMARQMVSSARAAWQKIPLKTTADYQASVVALAGLARAYHALGESNDALGSLQQAEKLVGEMKTEKNADRLRQVQVESLITIASSYQAIDRPESAAQAADQSLAIARQIADPRERGDQLSQVAALQSALKQSEAEATFELAKKSLQETKRPLDRAHGLIVLAKNLFKSGRRESAIEALNQAEQLADQVKDRGFREELLTAIQKARG